MFLKFSVLSEQRRRLEISEPSSARGWEIKVSLQPLSEFPQEEEGEERGGMKERGGERERERERGRGRECNEIKLSEL